MPSYVGGYLYTSTDVSEMEEQERIIAFTVASLFTFIFPLKSRMLI